MLLDEIGITIDCSSLTPYSRSVRWWLALPDWLAPLFPRLYKRAMRERMKRQAEFLSLILRRIEMENYNTEDDDETSDTV